MFLCVVLDESEDDDVEAREGSSDEAELMFIDVDDSLTTSKHPLILPQHLRCASHTLNLIATTDINKSIESNPSISRIHHPTLAKCSTLWNASGRPKSAEIIFSILGHKLSYPCVTRWNSMYDSICQIIQFQEKLPEVFESLKLKCTIKETELEYLREYIDIFGPLAAALDRLQGDGCYYGQLLPTLFTLVKKFEELELQTFRFGAPLLQVVKTSVLKRFEKYFELTSEVNEAIIATCTHPYFKLRWLPAATATNESTRKRIQDVLTVAAKDINPLRDDNKNSYTPGEDDWFAFDVNTNDESGVAQTNKIELELLQYLQDKATHTSMLDGYPVVRKLFLRYNTSLTSSGPVERLFSFAGIIHNHKRHSLSDTMFERLVCLKGNSSFSARKNN